AQRYAALRHCARCYRRSSLGGGIAAQSQTTSSERKPNILVIMGDDIGLNTGPYHQGITSGKTPILDKLAAEGMRFTDFQDGIDTYGPQNLVHCWATDVDDAAVMPRWVASANRAPATPSSPYLEDTQCEGMQAVFRNRVICSATRRSLLRSR